MKATVYKSNEYMGWFWRINDKSGTVGSYSLTKMGAIWSAKRYMKRAQRSAPSFEIEL